MKPLYCISHEKMVMAEEPILGHAYTENHYVGDIWMGAEIEFCEFESGWATCPPPEFDLDSYVQEHGTPPAIVDEFFVEAVL